MSVIFVPYFSESGQFLGDLIQRSDGVYLFGMNILNLPDNNRLCYVIERDRRRSLLWEALHKSL